MPIVTENARSARQNGGVRGCGDGESACKRDSVTALQPVTIHLCGLPGRCSRGSGRAAHPSCLALLRVGLTQPPESPPTLVRSYRTVSPLPVTASGPSAVCSLLHCAVRSPRPGSRQHPCPVESRLSSTRSSRAAATRPTHHRRGSLRPSRHAPSPSAASAVVSPLSSEWWPSTPTESSWRRARRRRSSLRR